MAKKFDDMFNRFDKNRRVTDGQTDFLRQSALCFA